MRVSDETLSRGWVGMGWWVSVGCWRVGGCVPGHELLVAVALLRGRNIWVKICGRATFFAAVEKKRCAFFAWLALKKVGAP